MNQHTNDPEFAPQDTREPDSISEQSLSDTARPVPRSGLGNADAWNEYQGSPENVSNPPLASSTDIPSDVMPGDESFPDPAIVPELAPLATEFSGDDHNGESALIKNFDNDEQDEPPVTTRPEPNAPRGGEQDLWSHLGELRTRILYSITSILLASVVTWNFGLEISEWFARPIRTTLAAHGIAFKLVTLDPTEGFLVYFQITIVAAILLAMPFILFQMWRFIEPALTGTERRFSVILVPFSVVLFFAGCALGYVVSPLFFRFFLMFQPPGTDATFSYGTSIVLLAKMVLVFGLCFQVPVITIFLNKIGLISRNFLIDYWRHAVVVIFTVVAVLTPTWDPLTLVVCAGPPCVLYGLSIWMVKWL